MELVIVLFIVFIGLLIYARHRIKVDKGIKRKHELGIECCPKCGSERIRYNPPRNVIRNEHYEEYDYYNQKWYRHRLIEQQDGYYQCNHCGKKWKWS